MKTLISHSPRETKNISLELISTIKNGAVICLFGDLGSGKTTFTQFLLEGLGVEGPFTSPTFNIMKEYENPNGSKVRHIDAYRINAEDLIDLGWNDFICEPNSITIVEWSEKIKEIIPSHALMISFQWISEQERKITIKYQNKNLT